jgi:YegS/Rv2252/BmrU family lipid kinase
MSVAIIINPLSGGASPAKGRRRAELAAEALATCGEDGDIFVTEGRDHARELAAAEAKRGARLVIAWGGDGTINEVASALVFGSTALGIVPSGSGNGLARDLKVSRRPEQAIAEALRASPRLIDAGELGGRLFFNLAGLGFDAHIATCFDRDQSGRRGLRTYARLIGREMFRYKAGTYCIDGVSIDRALLVTIANSGQFGNGARVAPSARVDDGWLDLLVFRESTRLRAITTIPRFFTGSFERVKGVTVRRIERVTISADHPIAYHVDGEPVDGGTVLEGRVHRAALRVAVR